MIYNYVNLIGWTKFLDLDKSKNIFFCDSMSLKIAFKLFRVKSYSYLPGSVAARNLKEGPEKKTLYLTHKPLDFKYELQVVLPDLSKDKFQLDRELKGFADIEVVVIGISSPTQNVLAQELQDYWPSVDIYCLGAMVEKMVDADLIKHTRFSRYNIEFVLHLITNPKRTLKKIRLILKEFVKITLSQNYQRRFRLFGDKFRIDD